MEKKKVLIIVGFVASIFLIGLSIFMIINKSNEVSKDSNGEVLNNTKVKGDVSGTTTPATETTKEEVKEETKTNEELTKKERPTIELCENENLDCMLERFKKLIIDTNEYYKSIPSWSTIESEINDLYIAQIKALYSDDKLVKYSLIIKYTCIDNKSKCMGFYSDKDKDEQEYYKAYTDITIEDNSYKAGDYAVTGGPDTKPEWKTIYEK